MNISVNSAKKIGGRKSILFSTIGLFIAYIFSVFILGFYEDGIINKLLWFVDFGWFGHVILGAVFVIFFAYIYGRWAGYLIIVKKVNAYFIGFLCSLFSLVSGTFVGSLPGYFKEGVDDVFQTGWNDYIVKPIFAVCLYGTIPVLILGFILGISIKKGRKI